MGTDKFDAGQPTPEEYLKRPYHRVIVPDEDGSYFAEISEFPGCYATADTSVEALASLERVAEGWLGDAIAAGQAIPEPETDSDYSGKLVVRLAKSLHAKAAHEAARDGVSLNAYICTAVAHFTGLAEGLNRSPSNIVNLVTGPNIVASSNLQQLVVLDPTNALFRQWVSAQAGLPTAKVRRRENA